MKNVLNAQERTYSISLFLVSFVVTVACIIAAVYFNTLIPNTENGILRSKIENFEKQIYEQQVFIAAMKEVKILNDSLSKLNSVHPLVDREITEHLNSMNHSSYKEGLLYGRLNTDIFNFAYEFTEMNKSLLNLSKDLKEVESLKNELNRAKTELEAANRSLDAYRHGANLGIR